MVPHPYTNFLQSGVTMPVRRLLLLLCSLVLTATASAQIVNCSSNDMHRHNCYANTSNGVRLERQISGSACTAGYSWGYEPNSIWVDHGCRADFAVNVGTAPQNSPKGDMLACKNAVSARQPNVPLAFIQVDQPRTNGGSVLVNFRVQPPNGPRSSGSCDVFKNGRVNLQFNSGGGNAGGGYSGGNAGGGSYGSSPNDAMRTCKNTAGERLSRVPLAYISVTRGSDTGNGSYMINFRAQPPGGPNSSGFCIIAKNGQLQNFQLDPGSGGNPSSGSASGQSKQDAMRACKAAVSARQPNVPLAFIQVDEANVNGGSLSVNFRSLPPNGPRTSGICDVFKNGRVNLQFDRR
jgi:hypothetical protein